MRIADAGALSFAAHAGINSVRFVGRLSATKMLATGTYWAQIIVTSAGARVSSPSLRFSIVRS
jgi:hypothetical protein